MRNGVQLELDYSEKHLIFIRKEGTHFGRMSTVIKDENWAVMRVEEIVCDLKVQLFF